VNGLILAFRKESRNDTLKLAFHMTDHIQSIIMNEYRIYDDWNRLEDFMLLVRFGAFSMPQSAFYFKMIEQTTNRLIDTGVMKHLIEDVIKEKPGIKCPEDPPKVLTIQDLAFGFNIWIGFCVISLFGFILETLFSRLYIHCFHRLTGKFSNHAKIWPTDEYDEIDVIELKLQTKKYFQKPKNSIRTSDCSKSNPGLNLD